MAFYGYCAWCGRNTQRFTVGQCATCGRRAESVQEPSVVTCPVCARVYDETGHTGCPYCADLRDAGRSAEVVEQEQEEAMHDCGLPGCGRRIPQARFLCPWHWRQVPRPLQDAVWAAWRRRLAVLADGGGPAALYRDATEAHERIKAAALAALGGTP
jgi:hypothetical protein